ncbi:MAG TPA: glycosyl hydrolase family 28 protein [Mucilaginibacter sp.]|jgi:polygalacturonase
MRLLKLFCTLFCLLITGIRPSYAQINTIFNIKDYGATGDGHTLDTKAINNTIAACVKAGGGTVLVPQGIFVTGTFRLFSNINLLLSPGAVIMASSNEDDYLLQADYGLNGSGAGGKTLGIVFADKAENVSITGTGIIDGNAAAFMYMDSVQVSGENDRKYTRQGKDYLKPVKGHREAPVMWKGDWAKRPGTQVIFHACKNVLIRDITVRNANDWTFDLNACDGVKVLGVTINNDQSIPNSDGIDMYDSNHVIVADCDVRVGDDGMAVISTSDLTVTNCSFYSRSCGIRIGYNAFNGNNSGNLLFNNIRIYGSNRGIGIFQRQKGNISNILFSNMIIDTRLYPGEWWGHGEPIHISAVPGLDSKKVGTISNVRFTNIIAKGEEGIVIYGSNESSIRDIRFDNMQLTLTTGPFTAANAGNFDLRPTNDTKISIFKHDIPAIYAGRVNGLTIKDVEIRWDSALPPYFTNAVYCEHFNNLVIDDLSGSAGPTSPGTEAVISLHNGKIVSIKDVKVIDQSANMATHKLLSQENVSGLVMNSGK